jgi:hypothetical protein
MRIDLIRNQRFAWCVVGELSSWLLSRKNDTVLRCCADWACCGAVHAPRCDCCRPPAVVWSNVVELDTDRRYVILDLHPEDFYYEFRKELIGNVIEVEYGRSSRLDTGEHFYCHATLEEPVVAENIIIEKIVFRAVKLGVIDDAESTGTENEAETGKDHQGEKAKVQVGSRFARRETGLGLSRHYS